MFVPLEFDLTMDTTLSTIKPKLSGGGIVVYRKTRRGNIEYLILKARWGYHWSIPKGHKEKNENIMITALRETEEETGIGQEELCLIDDYEHVIEYKMKKPTKKCPDGMKRVRLFLGKVGLDTPVTLSREHTDYRWANVNTVKHLLPLVFCTAIDDAERLARLN